MTEFWSALGLIAPYYNLVLVIILFYLFLKLFSTTAKNKKVFQKPWVLIFVALIIYVVEEVLTVLRTEGLVNIPIHINGFFELGIIIIFIYTLLIQKEKISEKKSSRKKKKR